MDYSEEKNEMNCIKTISTGQTITSLSSSPNESFLACGTWNGNIQVYRSEISSEISEPSRKKRKMNNSDGDMDIEENQTNKESCLVELNPHKRPVGAVEWVDKLALYGGTWKGLNLIDPNVGKIVHKWGCPSAISGLAFSFEHNVIVSSFLDRQIRIFDSRMSQGNVAKKICKSHVQPVSGVTYGKNDGHVFASTSYDGTTKLWDIRTSVPLFTHLTHIEGNKGFCIDWKQNRIATGGNSGKVQQFLFNQRT